MREGRYRLGLAHNATSGTPYFFHGVWHPFFLKLIFLPESGVPDPIFLVLYIRTNAVQSVQDAYFSKNFPPKNGVVLPPSGGVER